MATTEEPLLSDDVLPSEEEAKDLAPGAGSFLWRHAGDARLLNTAGWALVLQVSHPTVGAGVREHSNYARDPWGRLLRTLDFVNVMAYGGPDAAVATGRNVRQMHKRIKGVAPDGRSYHALEPEAYAWVHATLFEGIVLGHRRFVGPLSTPNVEGLYAEWRGVGRLLGIREIDMPPDWNAFRVYFDRMVAERLEHNDVVDGVLSVLSSPKPPPIPMLGRAGWRIARLPLARAGAVATVGLLPPLLRERFGLRWTRAQEFELKALAGTSRALTPVLPSAVRNFGLAYLDWRRDAMARGGIAVPPAAA
jgi:uncharacterized protein (DUF2236 family)